MLRGHPSLGQIGVIDRLFFFDGSADKTAAGDCRREGSSAVVRQRQYSVLVPTYNGGGDCDWRGAANGGNGVYHDFRSAADGRVTAVRETVP